MKSVEFGTFPCHLTLPNAMPCRAYQNERTTVLMLPQGLNLPSWNLQEYLKRFHTSNLWENISPPPRFLSAKNCSPAQCWCVWLNCVAGVVVVDISFESWHYRATTEFLLYRERIIAFFSYNHPCLLWVRDIYPVQGGGSVRQVVHHCLKLKQNLHLIQNKDSQIVSHKCGRP